MSLSAKELYEAGWRLLGWGFPLNDSFFNTILVKDGTVVRHWADGVNTRTEEAYSLLGVEDDADGLGEEVLYDLAEMSNSESERAQFPQFILCKEDELEIRQKMED